MSDYSVNDNSSVYYTGSYWNDLPYVADRLNTSISGSPDRPWRLHFAGRCGRTFERALVLNCGNGWVERELVQQGLVREAVGIDYSEALLNEARREAASLQLPITYREMDVNTAEFPDEPFDIVINFAAGHHIARVNRVFRKLCEMLPVDGWFVSYDYVGPHRNQYTVACWEAAWELNRQLPDDLQQDMRYPHLPDMIAIDPTEAIHSELLLDIFERYFVQDELIPLGGAIAYPLMTHNQRLLAADEAYRDPWVRRIMEEDQAYLAEHPDSTLFAYFTGQPNKAVLQDDLLLASWDREEEERESRALCHGGEYYPRTAFQTAHISWVEAERQLDAAMQLAAEAEASSRRNERRPPTPEGGSANRVAPGGIKQMLGSPVVRWLRSRRPLAWLEQRLRPSRV